MPPFPPKTTFFAAVQLQTYRGRATLDARRISPDTLLRPFRGSRLRSDMWGKPGIAGGMRYRTRWRFDCRTKSGETAGGAHPEAARRARAVPGAPGGIGPDAPDVPGRD